MIAKPKRLEADDVRAALVGREADIITKLLPDGEERGGEWWALNPSRPDQHLGSFSVAIKGKEAGTYFDFASGDKGNLFDLVRLVTGTDFKGALHYLARAVGMDVPDPQLTIKRPSDGAVAEWKRREASGENDGRGCTVIQLAAAKALAPSFLHGLGLRDMPARPAEGFSVSAVWIPYRNAAGVEVTGRVRNDVRGKVGTRAVRGKPLMPYGLDQLKGDESRVILVEGESDSWCGWYAGLAVVGLPGASSWRDEWAALLPVTAAVYVVQEPDSGGSTLIDKLRSSPLAPRLSIVRLPVKDLADLWTSDPDPQRFRTSVEAACAAAVPAVEPEQKSAPRIVLRSHADRLRERMTPGPMIVDELLPQGGVGALIAAPGVGKTLGATLMAQCIASGSDFAGRRVERGSVVYCATDAAVSTERRMLAIPDDSARLIMTATDIPQLPGGLIDLRDAIERTSQATGVPVRLAVLDTYDSTREHSGGNYSDQDGLAETILRGLRSIAADLHMAFLIVHHATRQDGGRARGTMVFDARMDWIAVVEQTAGGVTIRSTKSRDGQCGPIGLWSIMPVLIGGRPVATLAPADAGLRIAAENEAEAQERERRDRSLLMEAWTAAREGAPVSARELQRRSGLGLSTIARCADRLRAKGYMPSDSFEPTAAGIAFLDDK